ncbi:MAG: hypothetical protein KDB02_13480 [Acidimicrobiales bacterium]|nr:hypothetical protein [Acidimicrobiales bacterium]MCB1246502.1 hypothetical protein [Acidimicrobiia bacterium]
MSDDHKAALAKGRQEGNAVRAYLEALAASKPKRGRKRTEATAREQLKSVEAQLADASPLNQLQLTQRKMDLEAEIASFADTDTVDLSALEADFIASAAGYAERKKISYAAFRAVGVTPDVLRRAGISRRS